MNLKKIFQSIGPGPIIAAAFIGPGTVTVCTLAGAKFGTELIWAMVLSILITAILQENSGRIGMVTKMDLSELIRFQKGKALYKFFAIPLVLLAIGLGNAAYESGNLTGAALGVDVIWSLKTESIGSFELNLANLFIGIFTLILLWFGSFQILQRLLVGLVIILSAAFFAAALITAPSFSQILSGFVPNPNSENLLTIASLVGTTVVPYNLFLYASLAKKKWNSTQEIGKMRLDIWVAVVLGGLVSMAIMVVGASNMGQEITNAVDVSKGLESVFGSWAKYMMGIGLIGAGITSSLTAPLATGLVVCGLLGWSQEVSSKAMRTVMILVVLCGILFSSLGIRPIQLIVLAQLANGILLPLVSGWILWIAYQKEHMGEHKTSRSAMLVGVIIWLVTLALGIKSVSLVFS